MTDDEAEDDVAVASACDIGSDGVGGTGVTNGGGGSGGQCCRGVGAGLTMHFVHVKSLVSGLNTPH